MIQAALLGLQIFQVAILWLHDWLRLGGLSDPAAVRRENTMRALVITTCVQSVPWTIGLVGSIVFYGRPEPGWLRDWLVISYGILLVGEIRAWWVPYLMSPEPARAARYAAMFGNTHAFLPVRNGIVPNTLHVALHAATLATVILLIAV